eukprot:502913_1
MKVFTSLLTIIYLISVSSATPLSISNSLSLVSISSFIAFTGATSKNETALLRRRMRHRGGATSKNEPALLRRRLDIIDCNQDHSCDGTQISGKGRFGKGSFGKGGPLSKGGPKSQEIKFAAHNGGGKKDKSKKKDKIKKHKKKKGSKKYFSFASLFAAHSNDEYNVDGDENVEYEISFDNGKKDKGG